MLVIPTLGEPEWENQEFTAPYLFFESRLMEEEDLPIFSWRKTHPSRPPICFWKLSHGGRGPSRLLMEEASSLDSWKKIYIWSGCRKKSPLWRLIGFRPLWKQMDPSYSLLARLITSVAARSHYWAFFFFLSAQFHNWIVPSSWSLFRVVLWMLLSDLLCCPFLSVSFNDFM